MKTFRLLSFGLVLLTLAMTAGAADLQKGYSFSGTSPNNAVKLNALVDSGTILTGFYTGKTEESAAASDDLLLFYDVSAGLFKSIEKGNLISDSVARTGARGLTILNNTGTPNSQVDVTATEVVMRTTGGNTRFASSFSQTADITVYSGGPTANGRDFTPEAVSTWYYIWAISDGANDRTLISSSSSSPTLPAGYTYKALLGAVRNDAAGHFQKFIQNGNRVSLAINGSGTELPQTGGVDFQAIVAAVASTWQSVDLAKVVPPTITDSISGHMAGNSANVFGVALASKANVSSALTADLSEAYAVKVFMLDPITAWALSADFGSTTSAVPFELAITVSQTCYFASQSATALRTVSMLVTGFTLNL